MGARQCPRRVLDLVCSDGMDGWRRDDGFLSPVIAGDPLLRVLQREESASSSSRDSDGEGLPADGGAAGLGGGS